MTSKYANKMVAWDADFYKTLSDDECIVCLTERQVYLVGQIIDQLRWERTRWTGDKSDLDFDRISGDLENRIAERMTCQSITILLETVNRLEAQINFIANETIIDNGDEPFDHEQTTVEDVSGTPGTIQEQFSIVAPLCDTENKDKVYGAVRQLVDFIHANNVDLLERLSQVGNYPDQLDRAISAIPVLNELPVDEVISWVTFIVDELLEEYNATVDTELLQIVYCDLFCIAVANNCHLDFNDVYNYFAGKVSPSASNFLTTFANLVQFALTGTFSGSGYFYYMSYFQLVVAGMGQAFLDTNGMKAYAMQARAGFNSPDSDWAIFCLDCPPLYRLFEYDFARGMGDWTFEVIGSPAQAAGTFDGNRLKGVDFGDTKIVQAVMNWNPVYRVRAAKLFIERIGGTSNGGRDSMAVRLRPTAGSDVGSVMVVGGGFQPNGVNEQCNKVMISPFYTTGHNQLLINASVTDSGASAAIYIYKVQLLCEMLYAPAGSKTTEDSDICD